MASWNDRCWKKVSDVVENDGRWTSAATKTSVQRRAMSALINQRSISTRQHPLEDKDDPEVRVKTMLPGGAVLLQSQQVEQLLLEVD